MELISASRIYKAQQRLAAANPYSRAVTRAVSAVATFSNIEHPLTTERTQVRRAAIVVFTSDRGLAGAFSSNVLKETDQLTQLLKDQGKDVVYYLVGRKSVGFFSFRKRAAIKSWTGGTDLPVFTTAEDIAKAVVESYNLGFDNGGVDEIHLVFNKFISMISQEPQVVRLLPLEVVEGVETPSSDEVFPLYEFEPDVNKVLDALLPVYIESRIYNAMLQSAAAEHAARQKAMKSATENADKLIRNYTRLSNSARQSEITQQISEIVGGADALVDTSDKE
jgi:F-type H+-transporting ATPase subunit gamma